MALCFEHGEVVELCKDNAPLAYSTTSVLCGSVWLLERCPARGERPVALRRNRRYSRKRWMSLPSKLGEFVVVCRVDGLGRKERKRRVRPKGLTYTESPPNVLNERSAPLNQGGGMLKH